jgi:hypothetical protein
VFPVDSTRVKVFQVFEKTISGLSIYEDVGLRNLRAMSRN